MNRNITMLVALAVTSCAGPTTPALHAWLESDRLVIESGDHVVPAGQEIFECFYTDLITDHDVDASMNEVVGFQGEGGHHLIAHYTMLHQTPGHHQCDQAEMTTWHSIAGADGSGAGTSAQYDVPGLATHIPAGAQILLEAHYIGLGSVDRTVRDRMEVVLPPASEIRAFGNNFVMNEGAFEVPAHAGLRVTTRCHVPSDVQLAYFIGHMHEWGTHFSFERRNADGTYEMLYDTPWEAAFFSHPPVNNYGIDAPLLLHAGDELRTTCEWTNTEDHALLFPQEMCVAFGEYFPDTGSEIDCEVFDRVETPLP